MHSHNQKTPPFQCGKKAIPITNAAYFFLLLSKEANNNNSNKNKTPVRSQNCDGLVEGRVDEIQWKGK